MIQQAGEANVRYAFSKIRETLHKACKQIACKAYMQDLCSVSIRGNGEQRTALKWERLL